MERLALDEELIARLTAQAAQDYPDFQDPCPGSNLKPLDDVELYDVPELSGRIVWGTGDPAWCLVYLPIIGVEALAPSEVVSFTDRAPVDPTEPPDIILPPPEPPPEGAQQEQAEGDERERQMGGEHVRRRKHRGSLQEERASFTRFLSRLPADQQERVRERVRARRPELVAQDLGDHRHAVPPPAGGPTGDRD
jgi:hypothetical protein